jgi:hypothetical protein
VEGINAEQKKKPLTPNPSPVGRGEINVELKKKIIYLKNATLYPLPSGEGNSSWRSMSLRDVG